MKRLLSILFCAGILAGCSKSFGPYRPSTEDANPEPQTFQAIVTVKQDDSGTLFFQLDEDTRVYPVNYTEPFTGLKRIVCSLTLTPGETSCQVNWFDELEKGALKMGAADGKPDSQRYAGVDILQDWMTGVEDGFLTLHYVAWWGEGTTAHELFLLSQLNPENPYELTLLHNDGGDEALRQADSIIYFDINSLPSTEGDYVTLTLNWTKLDGEAASQQYRFKSRQ